MDGPSEPIVSSVAVVINVAKITIQSRIRPTGYHSSAAASFAGWVPVGEWPPEQRKMSEPPGGQRGGNNEGDAIGKAEDRAENRRRGDTADGGAERTPSERRHHERQRRQIEQQQ